MSASTGGVCSVAANVQIITTQLKWSTFYDRWLVVGTTSDSHVFSLSSDLVTWTTPSFVAPWQATLPALYYPSFLDPSSADLTTLGATARLYFTYLAADGGWDRFLVYYDATFAGSADSPTAAVEPEATEGAPMVAWRAPRPPPPK